jgi:hypothetical protein
MGRYSRWEKIVGHYRQGRSEVFSVGGVQDSFYLILKKYLNLPEILRPYIRQGY